MLLQVKLPLASIGMAELSWSGFVNVGKLEFEWMPFNRVDLDASRQPLST